MAKLEVLRDEKGKWLPGSSPNPAGRPPSESSIKALVNLRASDDLPEMYDLLLGECRKGNVKALNLYFSLLEKYSKDKVPNPLNNNELQTSGDLLRHLMHALPAFDDFTFDQILSLISVANNIKLTEKLPSETLASKLSDEQLTAIMKILKEENTDN